MSSTIGNSSRLPPFFISHSGKDRELVNIILGIFQHHHRFSRMVRPYTIINGDELSRSQKPHWEQIKDAIHESDAVLLILSGGIIEQEHTQNWVAFEVGIAAGCNPPKPVIAIRAENVQIPIPYLNYYYPYSPPNPAPHWRESDREKLEGMFKAIMYPLLSDANYKPGFPQNHCPHCKLRYYHHGGEQPPRCPCCSNQTSRISGSRSR
jgi:hypothetical protein